MHFVRENRFLRRAFLRSFGAFYGIKECLELIELFQKWPSLVEITPVSSRVSFIKRSQESWLCYQDVSATAGAPRGRPGRLTSRVALNKLISR